MYNKTSVNVLEYHRSMLVDQERVDAFRRAIESVVRPGDTVADIGCGSGILAFLACQAGARQVYAIETGPAIEMAEFVARASRYASQIHFVRGMSTRIDLPERVDIIVSETIGNFGLDEGILQWMIDGRRRFLKPSGKLIPRALDLIVAPVETPAAYAKVADWPADLHGLNFSALGRLAANNLHWFDHDPSSCISEPATLCHVDLAMIAEPRLDGAALFVVQRDAEMHGLAGWFVAELAEGVLLTNQSRQAPSWKQAFLPFAEPVSVLAGDRLEVGLDVRGNGALWRWQVRCLREEDGRSVVVAQRRHSTFEGELLSSGSLVKRAPSHKPQLAEKGAIQLFILEQMRAGDLTNADIAARLCSQYPTRFPRTEDALNEVRALAQNYGR